MLPRSLPPVSKPSKIPGKFSIYPNKYILSATGIFYAIDRFHMKILLFSVKILLTFVIAVAVGSAFPERVWGTPSGHGLASMLLATPSIAVQNNEPQLVNILTAPKQAGFVRHAGMISATLHANGMSFVVPESSTRILCGLASNSYQTTSIQYGWTLSSDGTARGMSRGMAFPIFGPSNSDQAGVRLGVTLSNDRVVFTVDGQTQHTIRSTIDLSKPYYAVCGVYPHGSYEFATVPQAVSNLLAEASTTTVKLSWLGTPVTSQSETYTVRWYASGVLVGTAETSETAYEINSLQPDVEYAVEVVATNHLGNGDASSILVRTVRAGSCEQHNCDPNATCRDTSDSFVCECNEGFSGPGTHCRLPGERPGTVGEQRILTILVNFPDNRSQPFSPSEIDQIAMPNVDHYLREVSYGKMWLTSQTVGWYELEEFSGPGCRKHWPGIYDAAIAAADKDVYYPDFDHVVVAFPPKCIWDGRSSTTSLKKYTTDDGIVYFTQTGINVNDLARYENVAAHELVHSFGIRHASSFSCSTFPPTSEHCSSERGNPYDPMGEHEREGEVMTSRHLNSVTKYNLGWFSDQETVVVDQPSKEVYGLHAIESPLEETKTIRVQTDFGIYHVEYRNPSDVHPDRLSSASFNGIMIYLVSQGQQEHLLRHASEEFADRYVLRLGQEFIDPNGTTIRFVEKQTDNNVLVEINVPEQALRTTRITQDESDQDDPVASGNLVVWRDTRDGHFQLYYSRYDASTETWSTGKPVSLSPDQQTNAALDDNLLVWREGSDIAVCGSAEQTQQDYFVSRYDPNEDRWSTPVHMGRGCDRPVVSDQVVIWAQRETKSLARAFYYSIYDADTEIWSPADSLGSDTLEASSYEFSGDLFVFRKKQITIQYTRLDPSTGQWSQSQQVPETTSLEFSLSGDRLAYSDNGNFFVTTYDRDQDTWSEPQAIVEGLTEDHRPRLFGDQIFWERSTRAYRLNVRTLYTSYYDADQNRWTEPAPLREQVFSQFNPAVTSDAGFVFWHDSRFGNLDIFSLRQP